MSISASVIEARRRRDQYSQICESQRIRRVLAAFKSESVTNWLKVDFWAVVSSSSLSTLRSSRAWTRWSSSQIRRRMVPKRSIAKPRFGGRDEAISRLMRDASLQPLPDVVIPICRGPSEWVDSRVKVQRFGASVTLTGTRRRRHNDDISVPTRVRLAVLYNSSVAYLLKGDFPPSVTKTASTTFPTSSLPSLSTSSASNVFLIHSTSPFSTLFINT